MKPKYTIDYDKLGMRIKYLREKNGLTQGELSNKIGIEEKTLSNIETNKKESVGLHTLLVMSNILGTNVNYLLGNEEQNIKEEYKEIKKIIKKSNSEQRVFMMDLARFVLNNKK